MDNCSFGILPCSFVSATVMNLSFDGLCSGSNKNKHLLLSLLMLELQMLK